MLNRTQSRRELLAGAVILLFGLAALQEGHRLGTGTLSDMGPGFVPMALGVLLCGVGVIIALTGQTEPSDEGALPESLDWRGALCILAGAVNFILLGQHTGLAPAVFASVFIAAMGDRTARVWQALLLALGVTVFGCLLFGMVLKLPIPLYGWR